MTDAQQVEQQQPRRSYWVGHRTHRALSHRTLAPPLRSNCNTLAERAGNWIVPWSRLTFPGFRRGLLELLGNRVTYSALKGWRSGRRTMPDWAREAWADHIEARCRAGLALVAELRGEPKRRRKPSGWQVVDPATGKDGRGQGARGKRAPDAIPSEREV